MGYRMFEQEEPYIVERKFDSGRIPERVKDRYEGYCRDLAELIAKRLNISCEFIQDLYIE